MTAHVKLAGQWSTVDQIYARVGGSWKEVAEGYVKIFGAWEQFFASGVPLVVDYLVIAGGGGGGSRHAGGGGAGGYRTSVGTSGANSSAESSLSLAVSTNYTVTVGAGGSGAAGATGGNPTTKGSGGSNSVFSTITSTGGGGGGSGSNDTALTTGVSGGSGGGGAATGTTSGSGGTGTTNQGLAGGAGSVNLYAGGGGGGANAIGSGGSSATGNGGNGGAGLASSITGSSVSRAGGGGGGAENGKTAGSASSGGGAGSVSTNNATSGTVNTGGGGGGAGYNAADSGSGGNGGSGVVILKYPDTYVLSASAGLSHRTDSITGYRITTFTAGTGTVSFSEAPTSDFELIETVVLTAAQASVTFDVSGLGSTYKHLQIRVAGRTTASEVLSGMRVRLGTTAIDTGNNYSVHQFYGYNGSVTSGGSANQSWIFASAIAGNNASANVFGSVVVDLLDLWSSSKYKTVRSLGGAVNGTGTNAYVSLESGSWRNTAAVEKVLVTSAFGTLAANTRISIYGLKG